MSTQYTQCLSSEPLTGDSALHRYARANRPTFMTQAIPNMDVDIRNNRSETPLIAAAQNGAVKAMKKLIELGAVVDHQDSQGNTAYHYAVMTSSEKTIFLLNNSFADCNIPNVEGKTPIHLLVMCNHAKLTHIVARNPRPMDLNFRDNDGNSPFVIAIKNGRSRMIRSFLDIGYDPNFKGINGDTSLHVALRYRNICILKTLSRVVHIDTINDDGHSPLAIAIINGNELAVDILWKLNPNYKLIDREGNTMLHLACKNNSRNITKHCLEHSDYIDPCNVAMETPLHVACTVGDPSIIYEICKRGADISAQDRQLRTALMIAIMSGHQRAALVLLNWEFAATTEILLKKDVNGKTAEEYCDTFNARDVKARILIVKHQLTHPCPIYPPRTIFFTPTAKSPIPDPLINDSPPPTKVKILQEFNDSQ